MTVVLKLGGSLLTAKGSHEQVDQDRLAAVVAEIATDRPAELVLVHGGGSFGHPAAAEHGVSRTEGTRDPTAIADISRAMERLNHAVIDALIDANVPAVAATTSSFAWVDDGVRVDTGAIRSWLEEGFVPVARGDIAARHGDGAAILSGDDLAVALAQSLKADRLGLCSNVPGVLDEEGNVIDEIERYEAIADAIGTSDVTDVTGGMGTKIRAVLDSGVTGAIFGQDSIPAFLAGELPGTRVISDADSF